MGVLLYLSGRLHKKIIISMFHKTKEEKQLEELLMDVDRVQSEIWRQISGGPNLQCIKAGHLRGPSFFELLDFDYDCNTIIEKFDVNALYLWGLIVGFIVGFFIYACCCRDSKQKIVKVYRPVFPESQNSERV